MCIIGTWIHLTNTMHRNIWISHFTNACSEKGWDDYIWMHILMVNHDRIWKTYFRKIFVVKTVTIITNLYSVRDNCLFFCLHTASIGFVWLYHLMVTMKTFWIDLSWVQYILFRMKQINRQPISVTTGPPFKHRGDEYLARMLVICKRCCALW